MNKLARTVTWHQKDDNIIVYNWINGQNFELFDKSHPMQIILLGKSTSGINPAQYVDEDWNYLVENKFIIASDEEITASITRNTKSRLMEII